MSGTKKTPAPKIVWTPQVSGRRRQESAGTLPNGVDAKRTKHLAVSTRNPKTWGSLEPQVPIDTTFCLGGAGWPYPPRPRLSIQKRSAQSSIRADLGGDLKNSAPTSFLPLTNHQSAPDDTTRLCLPNSPSVQRGEAGASRAINSPHQEFSLTDSSMATGRVRQLLLRLPTETHQPQIESV